MPTDLFLAIEIGGTKLQVVVGTGRAEIQQRHRLQIHADAGAEGIRRQIQEVLPRIAEAGSLRGAAIGFGGPVLIPSGRVARSHQIQGWSDFALQEWLSNLTGLPALVENDANIAALGEAHHGAGVGANPVFYVTLGSGVGGGLIVDRQIYHGARPGESELGHIRLDRNGTLLESRCSGWAVDARIREMCRAKPGMLLSKLTAGAAGGEARHLKPALEAGDAAARMILQEIADDLAFGLSHMVHLMHPQRIILGGGLALLGEPLRRAVADALPNYLMEVFRPGPELALAALGEDAVPVGCLVAAAENHASRPGI